MSSIELTVSEMACRGCITKIKKGLKKKMGIHKVEILPGEAALRIHFNEKMITSEGIYSFLPKLAMRIFD